MKENELTKKSRNFKHWIGNAIITIGVITGLYVGLWVLLIDPIIDVCRAYDNHTLTGLMIGIAIVKCLFSGAVMYLISYFGFIIGTIIKHSKE